MQQSLAAVVVALGGALGSVLRYGISRWFVERVGTGFPWGTLTINVSGSFAIAVVLQFALARPGMSPYLRLFLTTGVLGGYTTFSAYAFEAYSLGSRALPVSAVAYALGSVIAGIAAAYAGTITVRALIG